MILAAAPWWRVSSETYSSNQASSFSRQPPSVAIAFSTWAETSSIQVAMIASWSASRVGKWR